MNYDFNNLRKLLDEAGITVAEAAEIFKTSKPTVYAWCEGRGPNQPALLERTERLIGMMTKAVEAKSLPVRDFDAWQKDEKLKAINAALRKHL